MYQTIMTIISIESNGPNIRGFAVEAKLVWNILSAIMLIELVDLMELVDATSAVSALDWSKERVVGDWLASMAWTVSIICIPSTDSAIGNGQVNRLA